MLTVNQKRADVNVELLDADIRAALPSAIGIAWDGNEVKVFLEENTPAKQIALVRQLVEQHDSTKLSERQKAERERKTQLEVLRSKNTNALEAAGYAQESEMIQKLAARVAWLEQEILAIRYGE